jgi:hypothetical protein
VNLVIIITGQENYNNRLKYKQQEYIIGPSTRDTSEPQQIKDGKRTVYGRFKLGQQQANKRNIEWLLSYDQYENIVSGSCFYCDDYFGVVQEAEGVGLDRLDSHKGYEVDNVMACCGRCNWLKSDWMTPLQASCAVRAIIACDIRELRESSGIDIIQSLIDELF